MVKSRLFKERVEKGMFLLLRNRHCGQGSFVQQLSGRMLIQTIGFVKKK